jgi:hypothetical protein
MAKLDTGDGSPNAVLNGTINFLESGGTLGRLLQGSIFGILVSIATGGVNLIQSVFGLVVAPLDAAASVVSQFFIATVLGPLGIIETTADASGGAIASQFGPFALLVGVGVVLGAFWLIIQFLEEDQTPDFVAVPGFPDIPAIGPLDVGVEEEDEQGD